jgi:hypothetical protein
MGVWGDASLWYLIAQANGLNGSEPLVGGQSLILPDRVTNIHHSSDTFRIYDPNSALGDLSPTSVKPAKKAGKCAVLGQILLVVIAVAVSAVVAPWATGLIAGEGASMLGGIAAAALGGAIGGAAGSIASQAVGMMTGLQSKFDWKGVGMAAIGGAIGGGLGKLGTLAQIGKVTGNLGKVGEFLSRGSFLSGAVRGVLANTLTQGIGIATGLQKKFDWLGVATAGLGGGISAEVGHALGAKSFEESLSLRNIGANAATSAVSALANAAARSLVTGTDFGDNLMAALPDVIGSTIGNMMAGAASRGGSRSIAEKNPDPKIIIPDAGQAADPKLLAFAGLKSLSAVTPDPSAPTPTAPNLDLNNPENYELYTIEKHDTLSEIASRRRGLSVTDLEWLNKIDNPLTIQPGQQIRIPTQEFLEANRHARANAFRLMMLLELVGRDHIPQELDQNNIPELTSDGVRLLTAIRTGSALRTDRFHNLPEFIRALTAFYGTKFNITGRDGRPATLFQIQGSMPRISGELPAGGRGYIDGRFEYIVDHRGLLTHQLFVPGGTINGRPIDR